MASAAAVLKSTGCVMAGIFAARRRATRAASPPGAPASAGSSAKPSRDALAPATLRLWVEDAGEGIPPEEHERIFDRFYRCGSELRRATQGVGLGLAIVKYVTEAHGGKVTVRSALGQGSRFTLELPCAANPK